MNTENYDQVTVPTDVVGDLAAYLQPDMKVKLSVYEGIAVAIELPQRAVLEVVETEPTMKGQTASSSYKPALLSNGVRTMVPPHIARHPHRGADRRRLLRRARQGLASIHVLAAKCNIMQPFFNFGRTAGRTEFAQSR